MRQGRIKLTRSFEIPFDVASSMKRSFPAA
jgi:hypothetical protein